MLALFYFSSCYGLNVVNVAIINVANSFRTNRNGETRGEPLRAARARLCAERGREGAKPNEPLGCSRFIHVCVKQDLHACDGG
jgi:hypothetical protein